MPRWLKSTTERFFGQTKKNNECLEWQGQKLKSGYGMFWYKGKKILAHRAAWKIFKGEIPPKLQICHRCDNPSCVNVEHLFLGTQKENIQDMVKKGRYVVGDKRGEKNGLAKLTERKIKQIRLLAKKNISQQKIADKYGVHRKTISSILRKQTWSHI